MPKLIAIEGLDGSGKGTQSLLLSEALEREGYRVRTMSFPDYESEGSAPVRMYLGGELGKSSDDESVCGVGAFLRRQNSFVESEMGKGIHG